MGWKQQLQLCEFDWNNPNCDTGDADGHLVDTNCNRVWHGTEQCTIERNRFRSRKLHLPASGGHGSGSGHTNALGDFHANRYDRLHHCDQVGIPHGWSGNPHNYLVGTSRNHIRHGIKCHAAKRDGFGDGHVRIHTSSRHRLRSRHTDALGHVHS